MKDFSKSRYNRLKFREYEGFEVNEEATTIYRVVCVCVCVFRYSKQDKTNLFSNLHKNIKMINLSKLISINQGESINQTALLLMIKGRSVWPESCNLLSV